MPRHYTSPETVFPVRGTHTIMTACKQRPKTQIKCPILYFVKFYNAILYTIMTKPKTFTVLKTMLWLTENFHNYTTFSKFAKTFLIQASVLSIRNKKSDILICLVYEYILYKYVIFIYYRNGAVIVILTIYVYSLKLYKNRNCENYDNILSLQFFKHTYMGPYHYKPYRI